ncbi:ABC transporter ATP-binding protein [Polymorphum gilvum]|uniref:Branched-chain amino acid ABC transporter, permease protein n=1 Tax=Polymorphum gilvum (strain LMG 25793 / CGMCC 1.9160 / SL003B-26A1) TaxID=991905 RepID=F2J4H6_POLGS|nr:ABC transporter ATP-binding protein [Polymorphum gilvum]ADZ72229.1 Branched-chain amino acid ABC transporter, permease protein [Polymorphum gilvum SL003B-26A1]
MTAAGFLLSARGVRKAFGSFVALNSVDFDLPRGERHALIGPNGAGKSTFIACIAGQLPGVEGSILFKDREVARLMPADLARRGIGRTFQISRAFLHMTVLENMASAFVITSGRWASLSRSVLKEAEDRALAMLGTIGLSDRLETPVADLSLGDRKRLEFGMALAGDPELLLLDEPTAGMSIKERHHLMDLVAARVDETGKTLLFVEHDIDVVLRTAQRVTVMVRGAVLAVGSPQEIAANEEVQTVYLGGHS